MINAGIRISIFEADAYVVCSDDPHFAGRGDGDVSRVSLLFRPGPGEELVNLVLSIDRPDAAARADPRADPRADAPTTVDEAGSARRLCGAIAVGTKVRRCHTGPDHLPSPCQ